MLVMDTFIFKGATTTTLINAYILNMQLNIYQRKEKSQGSLISIKTSPKKKKVEYDNPEGGNEITQVTKRKKQSDEEGGNNFPMTYTTIRWSFKEWVPILMCVEEVFQNPKASLPEGLRKSKEYDLTEQINQITLGLKTLDTMGVISTRRVLLNII